MAGKYYIKGKDITTLCEPRITDSAWGDTKTIFTSHYTGDNTAIDGLHKGSSDISTINSRGYSEPAPYAYQGSAIEFAARGYLPTNKHHFGSITSPGNWYVKRTDAGIYFYDLNSDQVKYQFLADSFRNKYVPHEIFVVAVGGGGGGGGWGYYDSNGDSKGGEAVSIVGGAGGGGGVSAARVNIAEFDGDTWHVGKGGDAGSDGSTSSNSTGGSGWSGGHSGITLSDGELLGFRARGGGGGTGGRGNSNGTGTPGTGGTGGIAEAGYADGVARVSGGGGNSYQYTNRTTCAGLYVVYITEGTGQPPINICTEINRNGSSYNTHSNGNSGAYFSGGCSYGYGKSPSGGPGVGGGGGAGTIKSAGGNGALYLYY